MQANEIQEHVGKEVYWTKKEQLADVVSYEAGWVTIKTDDDEEHKVRAKELVVMGDDDDATEDIGTQKVADTDPSEASSEEPLAEASDDGYYCPSCGEDVKTTKTENIRCPSCGHMFIVRLHPKKENYIVGAGTTKSGRDTVDVDDEIAQMLRGEGQTKDDANGVDEWIDIVCKALKDEDPKVWMSKGMQRDYKDRGIEDLCEFFRAKYGDLNNGMVRMNLSNVWRGAQKRLTEAVEGKE